MPGALLLPSCLVVDGKKSPKIFGELSPIADTTGELALTAVCSLSLDASVLPAELELLRE